MLFGSAGLRIAAPRNVICIDPGHPSEVGRGTAGRRLSEIEVAWKVALLLRKKLEADGCTVVLTKSKEFEMVTNRRRAEIGNAAAADLEVRLHCDAANGSGFTTYYPDRQGTVDGHTGPPRTLMPREKVVASTFHQVLSEQLHGFLRDNGLKGDGATAVGSRYGALKGIDLFQDSRGARRDGGFDQSA